MIVLDIETTGLTDNHGAINLENNEYFVQDCRIDKDDIINDIALKINGFTREELYDVDKQTQEQLIKNYLDFVERQKQRIFIGQNIGWDASKIQSKAIKYDLFDRFSKIHGNRSIDLHTLAQKKYYEIHNKYFYKDGKSGFNLSEILKFCDIPDKRLGVNGNEIIKNGKPHNALEDCKLEGECYSRLEYGKNFFKDYKKYEVPDFLR